MAARELTRYADTRYCMFYIDNADDIVFLPTSKKSGNGELILSTPCSIGSVARDATGKKYTLDGNDEWILVSSSSSGNGSGDTPDLNIATDDEVDNMLDDVFM